jgi:hypothetical protein
MEKLGASLHCASKCSYTKRTDHAYKSQADN